MYFKADFNPNSPIVCNIPHAGLSVPAQFREDFLLSDEALTHEVSSMADMYTDELYAELAYVSSIIAPNISRIVVDTERFPDEEKEPMAKVGMSALYTKTSTGETLRIIPEERRKELGAIYVQYHNSFTDMVANTLTKHDRAIIVDCHSFPSVARSYEPDQEANRPDICIGTDEYHTPEALISLLQTGLEKLGYSVKINSPFSGTIVPMNFYQKEKRVISVMLETNRKLYMDEGTFERSKQFSSVAREISRCAIECINRYYSLS